MAAVRIGGWTSSAWYLVAACCTSLRLGSSAGLDLLGTLAIQTHEGWSRSNLKKVVINLMLGLLGLEALIKPSRAASLSTKSRVRLLWKSSGHFSRIRIKG